MSAPAPQSTSTTVSQHFITLFSNAVGIVAALAWADALSGFLQSFAVARKHPLVGPFVYAALITLLAWLVAHTLGGYVKQACTQLCATPDATPTPHPPKQLHHATAAVGR